MEKNRFISQTIGNVFLTKKNPLIPRKGLTNFLYKSRLQGIMVVLFIKTNMQSKIMHTCTMITRGHVSKRELVILFWSSNMTVERSSENALCTFAFVSRHRFLSIKINKEKEKLLNTRTHEILSSKTIRKCLRPKKARFKIV